MQGMRCTHLAHHAGKWFQLLLQSLVEPLTSVIQVPCQTSTTGTLSWETCWSEQLSGVDISREAFAAAFVCSVVYESSCSSKNLLVDVSTAQLLVEKQASDNICNLLRGHMFCQRKGCKVHCN